jgi:menaquinone-dependent protoporphyrinogen oxidase
MRILIAVGSRHGSTTEIADRLAGRLTEAGHTPQVLDLVHARHLGDDLDDLTRFDAYIVGSAIYEGHWLRQARTFVLKNAAHLQHHPGFLFSSGPLGDSEHVAIDFAKIDELVSAVDAVEHHLFPGRLERSELGRIERWIVDVVRAHDGDYREWSAIDAWATEVATHLASNTTDAV